MDIAQKVARAYVDRISAHLSKSDLVKLEPLLAKIPVKMDPEYAAWLVQNAKKKKPGLVEKVVEELKKAIGVRIAREYPDEISRLREVAKDDQLLAAVILVMKHNPQLLSKQARSVSAGEKVIQDIVIQLRQEPQEDIDEQIQYGEREKGWHGTRITIGYTDGPDRPPKFILNAPVKPELVKDIGRHFKSGADRVVSEFKKLVK